MIYKIEVKQENHTYVSDFPLVRNGNLMCPKALFYNKYYAWESFRKIHIHADVLVGLRNNKIGKGEYGHVDDIQYCVERDVFLTKDIHIDNATKIASFCLYTKNSNNTFSDEWIITLYAIPIWVDRTKKCKGYPVTNHILYTKEIDKWLFQPEQFVSECRYFHFGHGSAYFCGSGYSEHYDYVEDTPSKNEKETTAYYFRLTKYSNRIEITIMSVDKDKNNYWRNNHQTINYAELDEAEMHNYNKVLSTILANIETDQHYKYAHDFVNKLQENHFLK